MNRNVGTVMGVLAISALAAIGVLAATGRDLKTTFDKVDTKGLVDKCDDLVSRLETELYKSGV
jgi:hypothetical protein